VATSRRFFLKNSTKRRTGSLSRRLASDTLWRAVRDAANSKQRKCERENSADPRVGARFRFRICVGFFVNSMAATIKRRRSSREQSAISQTFLPLHGERDEQHEFGLAIPFEGWTFDVSTFRPEHVISSITMRSQLQSLFPARAFPCSDSRLGNHRTVAQSGWARATPSGLFAPIRRMVGRRDRRPHRWRLVRYALLPRSRSARHFTGGFDVSLPRRSSADSM